MAGSIYNSLGSNYSLDFALRALIAIPFGGIRERLRKRLSETYGGEVTLSFKGRGSLEHALRIIREKHGYEKGTKKVAVNGFTCFAVYQAIVNAGFVPLYLDIQEGGLDYSSKTLAAAFKKHDDIGVVVIQNTLGYPVDIVAVEKLAKKHEAVLIEDLAHSPGAMYANEREAGTVAAFTMLSFSQNKMIDAISGGALVVRDKTYQGILNEQPKHLVPLGLRVRERWYPILTYVIRHTYSIGIGKLLHAVVRALRILPDPVACDLYDGYRLPDHYCWFVDEGFRNIGDNVKHRREIARVFAKMLDTEVVLPEVLKTIEHAANLRFPIVVANREGLVDFLKQHRFYIPEIWYDAPVAPAKMIGGTNYQEGTCPNAEKLSGQILNLPTHREIKPLDAHRLATLINQWHNKQQ